jgi:serine-type D-Ala-D-Ala carboxypeptidase/endopeptidase (penicillin-binding protein 4)
MIRKTTSFFVFFTIIICVNAQTVKQDLQKAYRQFETDSQLKHAVSSLYVIDANTGQVVFEKNSQLGLAPASTQKIITAAAAFELLGKDYRYKTEVRKRDVDKGMDDTTYIVAYGDPSFGSWRFGNGKSFFKGMVDALEAKNKRLGIPLPVDLWFERLLPDGWIYQDIGNYYGAGAYGFNWHENQFDVTFIPGKPGEPATLDSVATTAPVYTRIVNHVKTGPAGSGDNAYIYFTDNSYVIKGTVPAGVKRFTISGTEFNTGCFFLADLYKYYNANNLTYTEQWATRCLMESGAEKIKKTQVIYTHYSSSLDSLIYWFLQKSINLYGEAFVKTLAYQKNGYGTTDEGIDILRDFWKQKGIDENELNISDGSGLSPQNRVTTHAQVEILKYAKKQLWYPYFYNSMPEYNKMKMKSGTIRNVKGFCGYHKATNGKEYIFSFLVNNYNGSASGLVNKMYKVLDMLK